MSKSITFLRAGQWIFTVFAILGLLVFLVVGILVIVTGGTPETPRWAGLMFFVMGAWLGFFWMTMACLIARVLQLGETPTQSSAGLKT